MRKDILAILILIVCLLGSIIGLVNTFNSADKESKASTKSSSVSIFGFQDKIALVTLAGVISDSGDDSGSIFGSLTPAMKVRKYINKAAKDKSVKAVILRINSPGGTVGASQEVYNAVIRCRKKKPVVVSMGDVAASGGYYIASAADSIVANPGTLTGSIGVIFNAMNFTDLMKKVGVKSNVIKSGKFKDIGSGFRPMSEADKALLQGLITDAYGQFIDDIIAGRIDYNSDKRKSVKKKVNKVKKSAKKKKADDKEQKSSAAKLTVKTLKQYADGRILSGQQAYDIGLVDELGGLYEAKILAKKLAKKKFRNVKDSIDIVEYDKPQTFSEFILEMRHSIIPKADITQKLPFSMSHPNQPLWIME